MWYKTRVTETLNLAYPIIQLPFGGGYSTPELVSAVSNAGSLSSFGAVELMPQQIIATNNSIRRVRQRG